MGKLENIAQIDFTVSIVSHLQIDLIKKLLNDIENHCRGSFFDLILTINVDEVLPFCVRDFFFPITIIRNSIPLGFGANHNQAFKHARGQYFCVMNPDIRLSENPFQLLISCLSDKSIGVAAPLVYGAFGDIEDSARKFPSPVKILRKVFGLLQELDYPIKNALFFPDWVGGMCMMFHHQVFKNIDGFDERYFLYYEDVDLCGRLTLSGYKSAVYPCATVVHHAQRDSHSDLKYFRWHFSSMTRFFFSAVYWRLQWHQWLKHNVIQSITPSCGDRKI